MFVYSPHATYTVNYFVNINKIKFSENAIF